MENKLKYFFLSIFALLLLAIFSSNRAMAVELDTVWVSDINGQVLFQHPVTKNILVAANGGITELNSQDGKFVGEFPFDTEYGVDISPDGTKILSAVDETNVFNFDNKEIIANIKSANLPKFFGNNRVIFRNIGTPNDEFNLGIYNLDTKEKKVYSVGNIITAISVSPNEKIIAIATKSRSSDEVKLLLLDAETMKTITKLGSWEVKSHFISEIQFSFDNKYITYTPTSYQESLPINIFNLDSFKINTNINPLDFQFETCSVILIGEYYIIRGLNLFNQKSEVRICNLLDNKTIFISNDLQMYMRSAKFNNEAQQLFCNTPSWKTFCFDLNNIISGVPKVNALNIKYQNKKLIISNNEKQLEKISIKSIEGREVYNQDLEKMNINNIIEIHLELSNGLYLINITSGKESFTQKLMVME